MQIYGAKKATVWFNKQFDQNAKIERFQYHFPNTFSLEGVLLPDHKGDTLFYIGEAEIGFKAWDPVSKALYLNKLEVDAGYFYMYTQQGDSISNLSTFIQTLKGDKPPKPNQSFNLSATEVKFTDSRFYLENRNVPEQLQFHWAGADGELDDFLLAGKDVSASIKSLSFQDGEDFILQNAEGQFLYGPKGLVVHNLGLTTGRGYLAGELTFIMESPKYYSQFVDSVYMMGSIEYAEVAAEDIRYFSEAYPMFPNAEVKGDFEGTVNDLFLENMELQAYQKLFAKGSLHLFETTSGVDLTIHTKDFQLQAEASEALEFLHIFQDTLPDDIISRNGFMNWQGSFHGGPYDFVTQSRFTSVLADLNLDVEINNLRSLESIEYKGQVKAEHINLAALIPQSREFGSAALDLSLDGMGLDPLTMQSEIKGNIKHLDFRDYHYRGMHVNGKIAEGNFNGKFVVKDPNLSLDFDGIASFGADTSQYDFKAKIDSANLYALHLVKDSLAQYRGSMDIDFVYLDADHWEGTVDLFDLEYHNALEDYTLKDVHLVSKGLDTLKELQIGSPMLNAELKGNYTYGGLAQLFLRKFERYTLPQRFREDAYSPQDFSFDLWVKDASALSQTLLAQLLIEPGTHLHAEYGQVDNLLRLNLESQGIRYGEHLFKDLDLDLLSGAADLLNIKLSSYLMGENRLQVDSLEFVNVFAGDSMNYSLDLILRDSIDSYGSFEGLMAILDTQAYRLQWDRGEFNFGDREFYLDTSSVMRIDSNGFSIDWLKVSGPSLKLTAAGYLGPDPNKIMRIDVQGLDLDFLNYFQINDNAEVQGFLEGNIIATELSTNPKFLAGLKVDSLSLNQVELGQMLINSDYDTKDGKIFLDASLNRKDLESLKIDGFYDSDGKGSVDLEFAFNRFQLAALEPFAAPIAENLRGIVSGSFTMKGPAKKPDIKGEFQPLKAGLTISFLQTDYNLTGSPKVLLDNESIRFPNLQMQNAGGVGYLNGEVRHRGFRDFYIDLQIDAKEMLVLNTGPETEDAYYGTAYASGSLKLQGPPSNVNVYAAVKSESGTEFNIPIGGATEVKQSGYVNFLPPPDAGQNLSIMRTQFAVDEGVSLDFDMDINPNAQVSIILDESTGNQLNGRGSGLINMRLEPNRDLELYGTYTIDEGEYRFNIEGMLAKNFQVERGGTVTWSGDPYAARLDLTAVYRTKANPGILTGEANAIPTQVDIYLYIQGPLTNPQVTFSMDLPRATSSTQSIIANRLNTDQAINQQVFSLLAINSFTPPSDFLDGARSAFNSWDLLAGQAAAYINRFTSAYDYEVSLSYQPANQGNDPTTAGLSQEELEVGVSKNFLEDRLTVNSSVEVPLNENNSSIAGDFELTYKLTEDGRVRAKAFNRSVDNNLSLGVGQQQLYQQGVGLAFKVDFDTYSELWQRIFSKATKEEEDEDTNSTTQQSTDPDPDPNTEAESN